jgi:hypothetical protein
MREVTTSSERIAAPAADTPECRAFYVTGGYPMTTMGAFVQLLPKGFASDRPVKEARHLVREDRGHV